MDRFWDSDLVIGFTLMFMVQFHLIFYISRPLPNTFALIVCNYAFANWLRNNWPWTIFWLACGAIIFRCEIVVLAFSLVICDIIKGGALKG